MYILVLIFIGTAAFADESLTTPPPIPIPRNVERKCNFIAPPIPIPRNVERKCNFIAENADNDTDENRSPKTCGISKVSGAGNKIVGGRNAVPGEFPWQTSFEMRIVPVISDFKHICGASIINKHWAVTAAHCIAGGHFSTYRISCGAHNISTRKLPTKYNVIPIVHEQYNPTTSLKNDIALLRLTSPMDLEGSDGLVNAVCLPDKSLADNVTGMATVTGWGTTRQGGSLSKILKAVEVPLISKAECHAAYGDDMVDQTMLCAGYKEGGKDSCQGDSGGPLVQQSHEGFWTLIGIVSWGKGCAQPNNPGVYTEVAYFMDWIKKTMSNAENIPGIPGNNGGTGTSQANYQSGGADGAPGYPDDVIIKQKNSFKSLFKI